ncbi:type IV pilin N-term methylation site GFxxxE [Exiguobacterium indicum]|uniref:Type II secretion system GspH family protein n=1 Tax=Exiguobacterium acetylicum TaxID=41170 RepID=A0ABX8G7B0_EXIAC|nr:MULTISPECIES: prepilin-type N-terminal cleavage/methylation domain-containing protein [Exiguobacterium]AOT01307.1 type IV pilin N-term methylation site GFxxxE [Exiguobacterium sp. U13-1]KTR61499.1 type IV pilin N-term methylation site GFxxxE [Exiguobacterium indicum]QWB29264.1 type II secretion system GspH family protein [Exiguobacterium acetylicum]HCD58317.1 prepilin-type N-terminal cleavage/methylation domain-containing protein [Exiguobacterium sp.]
MVERLKEIWLDAKQMRDERGLTLIELLVVVVILGIIAAIAVVAIGGLIENSRKDAVVSDAKQLVAAAKLYTSSNPVQPGETVKVGVNDNNDAIVANDVTKGTAAAPRTDSLKKYIDDMKDALNSDADYKDSYVVVTEKNGSYTYAVTLTSKSTDYTYFSASAPSALKRSGVKEK